MNVILINGPPRSGKDTVGELAAASMGEAVMVKFANPLRDWAKLHGLQGDYEQAKRDGLREELIHLSEDVIKPRFGQSTFGLLAAGKTVELFARGAHNIIVTDAGFRREVETYIKLVKTLASAAEFHLWCLYRTGTSFDYDSRERLTPNGLPLASYCEINNNGGLEELRTNVNLALASACV
jgi:hypothetical protein